MLSSVRPGAILVVFQYDFGKPIQDQEFQHTRFLNQPPTLLRTAIAGIQTQYERKGNQLEEDVNSVLGKNKRLRRKYQRPAPITDRLFQPDKVHRSICGDASCKNDASNHIVRHERTEDDDNPAIHYGLIASGTPPPIPTIRLARRNGNVRFMLVVTLAALFVPYCSGGKHAMAI